MVKLNVKIVSMQDADKFNKICSKFDCDMDLQSGKYYVDAKSIMGIFSLDLSKPLILNAGTEDEQKIKETFCRFYRRGIRNNHDTNFERESIFPAPQIRKFSHGRQNTARLHAVRQQKESSFLRTKTIFFP